MRLPSPVLPLSLVTALALTACAGEAEVDVDTSPAPTVTTTATETVTEEETVPSPTPVPAPDDGDATSPTPGTGDEDVAAMTFTECSADRYTIGYPGTWNTNEPDDLTSACTIFHPSGIDTPDQPRDRDLHWAVTVYTDAVAYEDAAQDDGLNEELHREELTVDGRDAHVREYRSTGDALLPEGELAYSYMVDLDGEILVVTTTTIGDTDYERDKAVIDRMVREELSIEG